MTIRVREAEVADGADLFPLWSELRAHYAGRDRRIVPAPVSGSEFHAGLQELLARPNSAAFVADDEGRVVGFITGSIERNQPDRLPERHAAVGYLYIDASYRRMGLGRQLFDAVRRWASAFDDVAHFEMAVLAADTGAEAFWRSLGFSPFIQRVWAPLSATEGPG